MMKCEECLKPIEKDSDYAFNNDGEFTLYLCELCSEKTKTIGYKCEWCCGISEDELNKVVCDEKEINMICDSCLEDLHHY